MIEIITSKTPWDSLVDKSDFRDSYYYFDYHRILASEEETPVLFHYQKENSGILLPLLLMDVPYTPYKDATSIWGYTGPLTYGSPGELNLTEFRQELFRLFKEQNIISVFCRLHPYLVCQPAILNGLGKVEEIGKIVNIDISKDTGAHGSAYSSRHSTYINKARRSYKVREVESEDDLELFIDLYYETMKRLKADPRYFFKRNYFKELWKSTSFETTVLLAEVPESSKVVCGAMFITSGDIIQYHHSGTNADFTKLHPVKLLIDEMRRIGSKRGNKFFNLGGGLGGSEDSLFHFKAKFSNDYRDFLVWKYIVNPEVYCQLSSCHPSQESLYEKGGFFPVYREETASHK